CAGAVGGVATAVPFVSTFQPSEKAKAAGAAVEVDISALKDGEKLTVEWRGKPVWIIKRTPDQIKELPELDSQLADPQSKRHPEEFTPPYAMNEARSIKPEVLVVVGICTHLGCSPSDKFQPGAQPSLYLIIESVGQIAPPKRYRNEHGQLLEHSPYCERDIRVPQSLPVHDETGEFRVLVKSRDTLTEVVLDHDPLDVVGWDGYYYPWALSIHDFEPITGSLHQPPPVHQTFQAEGFVICSFVPRMFDYHPDAVPAPYNHSNVMSEEVIFYANDEFMSRKGIGYGSLTLHPSGIPHGPHPGRAEASIGKERTEELAVMLDTFRPLSVAREVLAMEDPDYGRSWLD
ncbi:MAG: ubiquinol-cytochrome c reductase iron-sulfur subunit, partial [Planctomycetes bacterium]|nr:ubiquinol-cytochrome c reductase iron-sulfur subunit [Planctomycetota bacterium]